MLAQGQQELTTFIGKPSENLPVEVMPNADHVQVAN